ncbi:hypothetical protein ACFL96_02225 [Thermoproteota archaeon]
MVKFKNISSDIYFRLFLIFIVVIIGIPLYSYVFTGDRVHLSDDMMQEYLSHGIFRESILKYKRFPLWSPYIGGGYPLYAHPHDASMVLPLTIPVLLFGEVLGIKINILILYLLGILGVFLCSREFFSGNKFAVFLATLIYAPSVFFVNRLMSGNYNELFIFAFPFILYFYEKGKKKPFSFLISALLMVMYVFFAKFSFLTVMFFLFIFSLAQIIAIRMQNKQPINYKPITYFVVFGLFVALISIVKSIPMYGLLKKTLYFQSESMNLNIARLLSYKNAGSLGCFLLALLTGKAYILSLRFFNSKSPLAKRYIPIIKVSFLLLPLFLAINFYGYKRDFQIVKVAQVPIEKEFHQIYGVWLSEDRGLVKSKEMHRSGLRTLHSLGYLNFLRKVGTIDWYDDKLTIDSNVIPRYLVPCYGYGNKFPQSFIVTKDVAFPNVDYHGEAYVRGGSGEVKGFEIEPNRLLIKFDANGPAKIIVNQNYESSWVASEGMVKEKNGLILLEVDGSGLKEIVLSYHPKIFYVSLFVTLISLLVSIYLVGYNKNFRNFISYRKV